MNISTWEDKTVYCFYAEFDEDETRSDKENFEWTWFIEDVDGIKTNKKTIILEGIADLDEYISEYNNNPNRIRKVTTDERQAIISEFVDWVEGLCE